VSAADRFDEIARLFEAACELPAGERRAFLERECAGDRELLEEVLELLREDRAEGPLPETPASPDAPLERTPSSEFLRQLSAHQPRSSRYRLVGELARGGMGAVLKVWDEDLGRPLAMKVVLGQAGERTGETPQVSERVLARFLEEAQITGQLDHPGIVPVHELGLDERGRVFFTMRLVRGLTLKQVLSLEKKNEKGWTRSRALEVLLKVCDTMAFAHEKGVIHRDLKPSNVMVGRFGEVYVVDWGLARSRAAEGPAATPPVESAPVHVRTRRGSDAPARGTSPVYTRQGDVVGTPYYMSPEQARGDLAAMGPWSDIYSAGAMLYQLVAGEPPYAEGDGTDAVRVLAALKAGPPASLARRRDVPGELVAICERAMARDPAARYADMRAMAGDLRAFLDQRVVRAYRTGALVELEKWIARNRAVAASAALALVVAGVAAAWVALAERRRAQVLFDVYQRALAAQLVQERERDWVLRPESAADMRRWVAQAAASSRSSASRRSSRAQTSTSWPRPSSTRPSAGASRPTWPRWPPSYPSSSGASSARRWQPRPPRWRSSRPTCWTSSARCRPCATRARSRRAWCGARSTSAPRTGRAASPPSATAR
jgi:serine/threonine protein kinase